MNGNAADQYECTKRLLEITPDTPIVSNLGVSSFILIDIDDRPENFYMTSGMGSTTPMGFGLATAMDEPITVLEGDGSLLMSLGCLATVGEYKPSNLTIVLWNNATYETTGGQLTLAGTTDFSAVAENFSIRGRRVTTANEFGDAYADAVEYDGPSLVEAIVDSTRPSDHPSLDYGHSSIKRRFQAAMAKRLD